uniref:Cyclin C-terminal domain-containing protein n=2 Tax=Aegilops tauschii subsp. strangulata TaxID=200361 RepID=A0A453KR30_AEGTS
PPTRRQWPLLSDGPHRPGYAGRRRVLPPVRRGRLLLCRRRHRQHLHHRRADRWLVLRRRGGVGGGLLRGRAHRRRGRLLAPVRLLRPAPVAVRRPRRPGRLCCMDSQGARVLRIPSLDGLPRRELHGPVPLPPPAAAGGWMGNAAASCDLPLLGCQDGGDPGALPPRPSESTRYIFEPRTILRMELLVLTALNWRLRSVTPFTFIDFFACKVDPRGRHMRYLIARATQIILAAIHDIEFLDHCPSSMAAAAVLCAAGETPSLTLLNPRLAVNWCIGLAEEGVSSCYQLMQQLVGGKRAKTTAAAAVNLCSDEVLSCDSSSCTTPPPPKRRKRSPPPVIT